MTEINFADYTNEELVTLLLELSWDAEEGWDETLKFAQRNIDSVREEVINRMK